MQGETNRPKHCPECLVRGEKRKVKMFQVNLDGEAVLMCDLETCTWPFKTEKKEEKGHQSSLGGSVVGRWVGLLACWSNSRMYRI